MPLAGRMRLNTFLAMLVAGIAVCGAGWLIFGSVLGAIFWPEPDIPDAPQPPPTVETSPETTPSSTPAPASSSDSHEVVVMSFAGKDLGSSKRKDVTSGRAFKINVYQDDGNSTANRAKVDLDRDDKWDEKWTIDGASISRQVAPSDDESYSVEQTWSGTAWQ